MQGDAAATTVARGNFVMQRFPTSRAVAATVREMTRSAGRTVRQAAGSIPQ
jgi:hypothetical protein